MLDVTVLRSGIPDTVPGRSVNVCENGIAAMLAQELVPGESVAIEVHLPQATVPLRTRAIVRYQDQLCSGLEFMGLSVDQLAAIRGWAKEIKLSAGVSSNRGPSMASRSVAATAGSQRVLSGGAPGPRKKRSATGWAILLFVLMFGIAVSWWRWNRGWEALESGLRQPEMVSGEKPERVPAETMQRLLVHRVEPAYPAEARRANLQGIIALDIVVGRDGSVANMRALNGPEVLARAAMEALRWWKFAPYRVNGKPAVVETTVAVEFKK